MKITYRKIRFLLPIVVIVALGTFVYMSIYAHNPFVEIGNVVQSFVGGTMNDQQAPEIQGISAWINTDKPISIENSRGKVVLIHFWTYACDASQQEILLLNSLNQQYTSQGLRMVAIHTPEYRYEMVEENVRKAVVDLGINYPIAIDNQYKTWHAYNNTQWPTSYIIDAKGMIRAVFYDLGQYNEMKNLIEQLLLELK